MLKIDNSLLEEVGLATLPAAEKNSFLKHVYETLEMRVGIRLADQMTNQQLDEFEKYFEAKDDAGAFKWLETNFPNYKEIVQQEFDKLKSEVAQTAPQILASSQAAASQGIQGQASQVPAPQPSGPAPLPPTPQPVTSPASPAPQPFQPPTPPTPPAPQPPVPPMPPTPPASPVPPSPQPLVGPQPMPPSFGPAPAPSSMSPAPSPQPLQPPPAGPVQ